MKSQRWCASEVAQSWRMGKRFEPEPYQTAPSFPFPLIASLETCLFSPSIDRTAF